MPLQSVFVELVSIFISINIVIEGKELINFCVEGMRESISIARNYQAVK